MKVQNINSTAFNANKTKNLKSIKNNDQIKNELAAFAVTSAVVMSSFFVARDYMLNSIKEKSPDKYETLKDSSYFESTKEIKKEYANLSDSTLFSKAQKSYYKGLKYINR